MASTRRDLFRRALCGGAVVALAPVAALIPKREATVGELIQGLLDAHAGADFAEGESYSSMSIVGTPGRPSEWWISDDRKA
jgi:hypothetical protein